MLSCCGANGRSAQLAFPEVAGADLAVAYRCAIASRQRIANGRPVVLAILDALGH
jgi:hypothetical protein